MASSLLLAFFKHIMLVASEQAVLMARLSLFCSSECVWCSVDSLAWCADLHPASGVWQGAAAGHAHHSGFVFGMFTGVLSIILSVVRRLQSLPPMHACMRH